MYSGGWSPKKCVRMADITQSRNAQNAQVLPFEGGSQANYVTDTHTTKSLATAESQMNQEQSFGVISRWQPSPSLCPSWGYGVWPVSMHRSSCPPKLMCWNPHPQGACIRRWSLLEVIRSWRWYPHKCYLCPYKRDYKEFSCPFCHVKTLWKDGCPRTRKLVLPRYCKYIWYNLLVPYPWISHARTVRNKCLLSTSFSTVVIC